MRLHDCKISALAAAFFLVSCGPARTPSLSGGEVTPIYPVKEDGHGKSGKGPAPSPAYPWTSGPSAPGPEALGGPQDKNTFLVHVDKEGLIHLGGSVVTEEQFLLAARQALEESDSLVAILFIESGVTQGIHLSAELSKLGYRSVQIFYPTATNR